MRLVPMHGAVVWDRDLFKTPQAKLLEAKPLLTVVGGRVVFEAQ